MRVSGGTDAEAGRDDLRCSDEKNAIFCDLNRHSWRHSLHSSLLIFQKQQVEKLTFYTALCSHVARGAKYKYFIAVTTFLFPSICTLTVLVFLTNFTSSPHIGAHISVLSDIETTYL